MALTGLAFLGAYIVGIVLAFAKHPRFGLYVYLAVYYLDPPSRWWGASLPPIRWSLVAAVFTLIAVFRMKRRKDVGPWYAATPARILILFTAWLWIQNLWAISPAEHLDASVLFTKYVILFAVIYRLMDTASNVKEFLFVHVVGCGYLGWLAYVAPAGGRLEGVGGPGIDEANALGMFIATGIVCGAMLILVERKWRQWVVIAAMPFLLNAIVQSQSRGAMIALLVAGAALFYLKPRAYRRLFYFFGILGLGLFLYVAQGTFWNRMKTLQATVQENGEIDSSAESRVVLAKAQLRMAIDYPFGVGHRGTAVLSPRYLDERWLTRSAADPFGLGARSSHNTFMTALVEQGIPGAVMFLWLVGWLVRQVGVLKLLRSEKADSSSILPVLAPAAFAACIVVFVAGNFTDYLKTEVQIWMLAILATTTLVLHQRDRAAAMEGIAPAKPTPAAPAGNFQTRHGEAMDRVNNGNANS